MGSHGRRPQLGNEVKKKGGGEEGDGQSKKAQKGT